jgi:uncharacterized protein
MKTITIHQQTEKAIRQIVDAIIKEYQPQQIILYGSLAYGVPDADSDIDLLIIKETDKDPLERRVLVRQIAADSHRRVPFSPLVLTPDELRRRLVLGDPFYQEIMQRGKILYASR